MKTKLLYIILVFTSVIQAQSFQWIKSGGSAELLGTNNYEQVYSIATDSEKNVYVLSKVGMSNLNVDGHPKTNYDNPSYAPTDIVLASFACDGSYRWSKVIGGEGGEDINSVQVDSQDNVYVAGKIGTCHNGSISQPYPGRIENDYTFNNTLGSCDRIFLARFDKYGNFQYIKRPQLPTTSTNSTTYTASFNFQIQNDILHWFVWLPPGIYADGSFTNSNTETHTPYVLKYNLDGSFIEATQLGAIQGIFSLAVSYYRNPYNGFYYMTYVRTQSSGTFSINNEPIINAAALICYDNNGQYLWKRENTLQMAGSLKFYSLDFDSQNNIYIGGKIASSSLDSFMGFTASFSSPAFVMKLDPSADNLLWASHHSSVNSAGYGALVYNGNEVAFTGWCAGINFTWGSQSINVTAPNQGQDVLLARFDSATGDCLSLNRIVSSIGSTDRGAALAVDASGDYLVGGGFGATIFDANNNSLTNPGGAFDFFIAKFATEPCSELSTVDYEMGSLKIYPNPVVSQLTVAVTENANYSLFNSIGQLIRTGKVSQTDNSIDLQELSKGIYLLKITTANGSVQTTKVIKE